MPGVRGVRRSRFAVAAGVASLCVGAAATPAHAEEISPAEWLKRQEAPAFRTGHTLPPLTRFGWTLPVDARIELAERWGYCLEFGGYATTKAVEKALADPVSPGGRMIALAARDPGRYPLAVICSRELPAENVPPETWTRDTAGRFLDGTAKSMDGNEWHRGMKTIFSPEAPDSYWREAARLRADPIRRIRERCRVAVVKARGETPWFEYISERKAHQEMIVSEAVRAAAPDRRLYIYYPTTGGTHRNRWGGWVQWGFGYEWMRPVSDLASSEAY